VSSRDKPIRSTGRPDKPHGAKITAVVGHLGRRCAVHICPNRLRRRSCCTRAFAVGCRMVRPSSSIELMTLAHDASSDRTLKPNRPASTTEHPRHNMCSECRTIVWALLALAPAFAFPIGSADAFNEQVSVSQLPSGRIVANVSANFTVACPLPTTNLLFQTASTFLLVSEPAPSSFQPGSVIPYSAAVDLGVLSDGDYRVDWNYSDGFTLRPVASQQFAIRNGALVPGTTVAIPATSAYSMLALIVLISLIGYAIGKGRRVPTPQQNGGRLISCSTGPKDPLVS
jgi:hypothetical protein